MFFQRRAMWLDNSSSFFSVLHMSSCSSMIMLLVQVGCLKVVGCKVQVLMQADGDLY